jgi:hypothetical protein
MHFPGYRAFPCWLQCASHTWPLCLPLASIPSPGYYSLLRLSIIMHPVAALAFMPFCTAAMIYTWSPPFPPPSPCCSFLLMTPNPLAACISLATLRPLSIMPYFGYHPLPWLSFTSLAAMPYPGYYTLLRLAIPFQAAIPFRVATMPQPSSGYNALPWLSCPPLNFESSPCTMPFPVYHALPWLPSCLLARNYALPRLPRLP